MSSCELRGGEAPLPDRATARLPKNAPVGRLPSKPLTLFDTIDEPEPTPAPTPAPAPVMPVAVPPELKRLKILGPAPAPIYKLRDFFRFHIQIHFPDRSRLQEVLRRAQEEFKTPDDVQWVIDMDPISML